MIACSCVCLFGVWCWRGGYEVAGCGHWLVCDGHRVCDALVHWLRKIQVKTCNRVHCTDQFLGFCAVCDGLRTVVAAAVVQREEPRS